MRAKPAHAGIIARLECRVRFDVGSNNERLNKIAGLAIGAGLIKPCQDHDDGLAIDDAGAVVHD
jgi:hypothetical protein